MDDSHVIWEKLKKEHPEILSHCECESIGQEGSVTVVNSKGWEMIWLLLLEYLLDPDFALPDEGEAEGHGVALA